MNEINRKSETNRDAALEGIDETKRETLIRLMARTAFVAPIVASYTIDDLIMSKAQAKPPNGSGTPI